MNAPRMTGTVCTPAQNWLQHVRFVLKPTMSCSWPKTRMSFALRACTVRGTCAQDWAKGAAEAEALEAWLETLVVAVAVAATSNMASAAPARSQRRLRIYYPSVAELSGNARRRAHIGIGRRPLGFVSQARTSLLRTSKGGRRPWRNWESWAAALHSDGGNRE